MITTTALTRREIEVICLVAQGYSNKEIAKRLSITANTVGTFIFRTSKALGLHSRVHLVLYAFKTGLVNLEDIELPEEEVAQ